MGSHAQSSAGEGRDADPAGAAFALSPVSQRPNRKRKKPNPNFKPEAKSCPKEEWFKLSKEQMDAVIKLQKEARQKKKSQADLESKRIVAATAGNLAPEEQANGSKTD